MLRSRSRRQLRAKRASNDRQLAARLRRLNLERLEDRRVLTLIGVNPTAPLINYDSTGVITYDPVAQHFSLTASPLTFQLTSSSSLQPIVNISPTNLRSLSIQVQVDNNGNLLNDGQTTDFTVTGNILGN